MVVFTMPDPFNRRVHAGLEVPMLDGDDEYTAMIRSLVFHVECYCVGDLTGCFPQVPDLERVDSQTRAWLACKLYSSAEEEKRAVVSMFAYVSRFDSPVALDLVAYEFEDKDGLYFLRRFATMNSRSYVEDEVHHDEFFLHQVANFPIKVCIPLE